jgi:ribonuclease-3
MAMVCPLGSSLLTDYLRKKTIAPMGKRAQSHIFPEEALGHIEQRIQYVFKDRTLLQQGLTHASVIRRGVAKRSYERLEFLGDRVLGLCIAQLLYEAFPDAPEGELSRRLAKLVCKQRCADIAELWGLGPALYLNKKEMGLDGRANKTILADACESCLGAIFVDGGYQAAFDVIARSCHPFIQMCSTVLSDAKTALQEWSQGQGLEVPVYRTVRHQGPAHAPYFWIAVSITGYEECIGEGSSKRTAEQKAAGDFLRREGVWPQKASESE